MYWPQIDASIVNSSGIGQGVKAVWLALPSTVQLGVAGFTAYLLGSLSNMVTFSLSAMILGFLPESLWRGRADASDSRSPRYINPNFLFLTPFRRTRKLGRTDAFDRRSSILPLGAFLFSPDERLYFSRNARYLLRRYLQRALGSYASAKDLERYPIDVLIAQRDLALMRLLKEEPAQHDEIDRLDGESHFRQALALPLITLSALLSMGLENLLPALVGIYFTLFFMIDSSNQKRDANLSLANALYLGYSSIPTVDAAVEDFKRGVYKDCGDWLETHLRNEGFTDEARALSGESAKADDQSIQGDRDRTAPDLDAMRPDATPRHNGIQDEIQNPPAQQPGTAQESTSHHPARPDI